MGLTQVSTDGVKNDAITKTKIPANQIEASELADNAVDTNAIANNAVTAGKLASGVQTTINNNADNRVITGSGTANTLEGENNLVFDGTNLGVGTVASGAASIGQDKLDIRGGGIYLNSQSTATSGALSNKISFLKLHVTAPSVSYEQARIEAYTENGYGSGGLDFYYGKLIGGGNYAVTKGLRLDHHGRFGIQGEPNNTNFGAKLQVRESGQSATTLTALFGANENSTGTTGGISDNTNKACRIGLPHYDTDQKAAAMLVGYAGNGVNELYLGGGTGIMNAATSIRVYADSSSSVNNGGNQVARFDSDGLKFGTDTAAANALDDYEEGTWTPALSNGTGITVHSASYTKVGNLCNVSAYVTISSNSSSGMVRFNSLPFTAANVGYPIGSAYTQSTGGTHVFSQIDSNSTNITIYKTNGGTIYQSELSGAYVLFSGTYRTT